MTVDRFFFAAHKGKREVFFVGSLNAFDALTKIFIVSELAKINNDIVGQKFFGFLGAIACRNRENVVEENVRCL